MEHVRLLLAIFLSFLVFLVWNLLFVNKNVKTPHKAPVETVESGAGHAKKETTPPVESKIAAPAAPAASVVVPGKSIKRVTIDTSFYTAEISEKGAALTKFVLKKYKTKANSDSVNKELIPASNQEGTALVSLSGKNFTSLSHAVYTTNYDAKQLNVTDKPESLSFFCKTADGLILEKRFVFYPESYKIGLHVTLVNRSAQKIAGDLIVSLTNPLPAESSRYTFEGPFAYINKDLQEIDAKKINKKDNYSGYIQWAGLEGQYFMTTLIPKKPMEAKIHLTSRQQEAQGANKKQNLLAVDYMQSIHPLLSGSQQEYSFLLFFGPKSMPILRSMGHDLDKALNFGWFDFIAKPCLWAMNEIYNHVYPNYGVAIILLTIIFKILFWPLGNKSYKSMAEMKKLQPLMAEIRKKYKDDKKQMNEEIMRLYKTYKVNPMSGCLPMVVQIPVFFAFYRMLYEAIELRHAPFMLWINDLSAPDRLFHFHFSIPFMTPPYGIPVLTIIMGLTMFLQQKLSPPPGDPSQAKFMMLMPIIFTVIFINFPSGLVLYWLVNNILSIAQQYYITRKIA